MCNFRQTWLLATVLLSIATVAWAEPVQSETDHLDVLTINPNLQLRDVLEITFARNPAQAHLQSLESVVSARKLIANALLPASPALLLLHQNDALASGRNEREWQAELELPVWQLNQRSNRLKVAEATRSNVTATGASLKLQVAGLLRDALWDIALNENNLSLAKNRLELARELERDVDARFKAGEVAKTDVMLAQQETLRIQKEYLRAEAEVMHARHRYFLLTGIRELPGTYTELQSAVEDYSQSSIWLAAESKLDLAETERNLVQIESRENLHLTLNMRSARGAFDNLSNESVGVKVRIPFGEDASAAPMKAAAQLGVGDAMTELTTLRYALETMMHEAEHNLSVSRAELVIANRQFDIAQESARLAQKAFKLGETDLVSLLRVQSQTYEAERSFTTRKIQLQWDIARYNQIVGVLP
jgi:cobalt-zinc-cadmium efflux system outer membrane protein